MEDNSRELATNRLLAIIRSGRPPSPARPANGAPANGATPAAPPATPAPRAEAAETVTPSPAAEPVAPPVQEAQMVEAAPVEPTLTEEVQADLAGWLRKAQQKKQAEAEATVAEEVEAKPGRKPKLPKLPKEPKPPKPPKEPKLPKPPKMKKEKAPKEEKEAEVEAVNIRKAKRRRKGKRYIALDLGTSSIKLVEVIRRDKEVSLARAAMRSISPAIRRNQSALQMFLDRTIRELLPVRDAERADLHILLPDQSVQIRTLAVPAVAAKERLNAIKFQIKKELPFPLEVCEITYSGWNPKIKDRQDVEVMATDRRALTQRLAVVTEAGLKPIHVTAFPTAVSRLVQDYRGTSPDKGAVAVVDIGAAKTTITIYGRGKLELCRTIATGGDDFTAVLQGLGLGPDGEDLNEVQAETFKKNLGLPAEGDTSSVRVAILMRPVAERISGEVARSLELYRRNTAGGDIQKVILVGGGAQMIRLAKFLSKNIGLEVEVGDPLARLPLEPDADEETQKLVAESGPAIIPALGVALDFGRHQNILPDELRSHHRLKSARRVIPAAAAILLIMLMVLYSQELRGLDEMQLKVKGLKEQIKDISARRAGYMVAKAEYDRLAGDLSVRDQDFNAIRIDDPRLLDYVRTLSFLVPENIYLEQMRTRFIPEVEQREAKAPDKGKEEAAPQTVYSILAKQMSPEGTLVAVKRPVYGRVLELNGNIYPQGAITDVQLVDFVFALEKSGYFRDVAVDTVAALESGKVKFTILCGF